nr:phospholipase-like protein [Tanacetum cinerariifolium]
MTRTVALVDVDGKISMLDMMNHFGCMLTTTMRVRCIMIMEFYGCIPTDLDILLQNSTPLFYAKGDKYATPWSDIDQVFFPNNETAQHWCLAQLDILSGLVTFYDSGDTYDYEWRDWDFRVVRETYVTYQEFNVCCQKRREQMIEMQPFLHVLTVLADSYNLLKDLQDYELEKCRELMKSISETQLKVLKKISFIAKLHRQQLSSHVMFCAHYLHLFLLTLHVNRLTK